MSNNDIFSDLLTKKSSSNNDESQIENNDEQIIAETEKVNDEFSSFDYSFNQNENLLNKDYHKTERRKSRDAIIKMTKEEYRQRLEELNENADNKNFIILFGIPDCGKTYVIASLLHYMRSYLEGNTRLNKEVATKDEAELYNQMAEMFINPGKSLRTDSLYFSEINVIYKPHSADKREIELTFLDASGENLKRVYDGGDEEYEGELPDYLEAVLESDVNCHLVFIYDQSNKRNGSPPQSEILKAMYDKVLAIQDKYNKVYPKVLLLSKADKIPEKTKQKYGHSAREYALSKDNDLRSFAQGFFNEKYSPNRSIFYSMGIFTKFDDLDKFDADCPHRLFDWIYSSITGDTVIIPESWWKRFLRWLLGR